MKKTRTYLTLISIAWLLTACGVDIVAPADLLQQTGDLQSAENAIVFSAGLEAVNTKAADEVKPETSLNGKSIGVFAAYTGDVKYNLTTVSPNYMFNQQVTSDGTNWTYTPIKYWPNTIDTGGEAQDYVSFFCYYPYISATDAAAAANAGGIIGFCNNNVQGDPWLVFQIPTGAPSIQTDLMYGVSSTGKPMLDIQKQSLNDKVDFTLRHALACVGDAITIKCDDAFKTALQEAATASSGAHSAGVTFSVYLNKITIDYKNLTSKAKLILNSDTTPNWQPVYSGEQITSRNVNISEYPQDGSASDKYIYAGVTHKPILSATSDNTVAPVENSFIIAEKGLFYIPMHTGSEGQKAEITVDYTTTVSWGQNPEDGYSYTGTVSNSFTLAENPQGKEPFNIVFSPNLPVGLDIAAANVAAIPNETYTGLPHTPEPTVTYGTQALVKDVDYTLSYDNNTKAGNAKITITGIGKYAGAKDVTFTINKKQLTVTANDVTRTYGSPLALPVHGYTISGFVNNEKESDLHRLPECYLEGDYENLSAGTYGGGPSDGDYNSGCIRVHYGDDDNYSFYYVYGTLTIEKAPLHVFANDTTITYGEETPSSNKLTVTYVGFKYGQSVAVLPNDRPTAYIASLTQYPNGIYPAGSYDILIDHDDHTTEPTNYYYASFTNGTLTVQKAPLYVTADDKVKTYGTAVEASTFLTYHITGLKNGDLVDAVFQTNPSCSIAEGDEALTATGAVGTYTIIVGNGGPVTNCNYTITYLPGTLTINKYVVTDANWGSNYPTTTSLAKGVSLVYGDIINYYYGSGPDGCPPPSSTNVNIVCSSSNPDAVTVELTDTPSINITANSSATSGDVAIITISLESKNYYYGSKSITITIPSEN